ncbi:MAG: response regulator [Alphaproteobacteria bacterium]|nr:response regulator [Alphaproteobacteria bacterium]
MSAAPIEGKPIDILLVEDNEGDIFLTRKVFEKAQIKNTITVAEDGEKAIELLKGAADRPDIILLDINLPKKDGKQVLEEIKSDPSLRAIPVVILTSSQAEKDILESYDLHANSYIIKPVTLENFGEVAAVVENFWFGVVALPSHPGASKTQDKQREDAA